MSPARWGGVALVIAAIVGAIFLAMISPSGANEPEQPGVIAEVATPGPSPTTADTRVPTVQPAISIPPDGEVTAELEIVVAVDIPDDEDAVSAAYASVDDAVRLGADAVGYTIYVGSPRQDLELREFRKVREACERLGMPLVIFGYSVV